MIGLREGESALTRAHQPGAVQPWQPGVDRTCQSRLRKTRRNRTMLNTRVCQPPQHITGDRLAWSKCEANLAQTFWQSARVDQSSRKLAGAELARATSSKKIVAKTSHLAENQQDRAAIRWGRQEQQPGHWEEQAGRRSRRKSEGCEVAAAFLDFK